jgi:hypothetical protein
MTLREPQIYIVKSASVGECEFGEKVGGKVGDWVNGYLYYSWCRISEFLQNQKNRF